MKVKHIIISNVFISLISIQKYPSAPPKYFSKVYSPLVYVPPN